eukprot:TRINITY_DN1486_c1_g1_i1.p3 TRINITY_DN1486_c1_g1~~TRINITY_DN1486_c1_g1_i1.p3  ORF type:complete len:59 (+),score=10.20 TRINITY_DN1486_c1_g1_i1:160-336(+)
MKVVVLDDKLKEAIRTSTWLRYHRSGARNFRTLSTITGCVCPKIKKYVVSSKTSGLAR